MQAYQITLILAFALGMAELLTGAFLFLGMAVGAVSVALLQWLNSDWSLNRDLLLFATVSVCAFGGLRKWFARASDQSTALDDINRY